MKFFTMLLSSGSCFLFFGIISAQVEIPANPTVNPRKFTTRKVGGGVDPGASVDTGTPSAAVLRNVTHVVLYQTRCWTSTDGKTLEAKLIAFEDMVFISPADGGDPVMPAPPEHPTLVRNGKVRLLIGQKPVVVVLEKLSEADRQLIGTIQASVAPRKPSATP